MTEEKCRFPTNLQLVFCKSQYVQVVKQKKQIIVSVETLYQVQYCDTAH